MKKHNFLAVYCLQNTKTLKALPLEGCITALVSNQVTVYGQNAANKITGIQKYDNSVWGLYYLLKLQSQTVFEACVYSGVAHTKNKKQYCGHYFLRVHSKAEPNWTNTPWMLTQICDPDDTDWTVPVMCNKSHPRVVFLGGVFRIHRADVPSDLLSSSYHTYSSLERMNRVNWFEEWNGKLIIIDSSYHESCQPYTVCDSIQCKA